MGFKIPYGRQSISEQDVKAVEETTSRWISHLTPRNFAFTKLLIYCRPVAGASNSSRSSSKSEAQDNGDNSLDNLINIS